MQTSRIITSTLVTAFLAVPLLAGCPKLLGDKGDADAAAEAEAVPVVTASAASIASVEPSADTKKDPRTTCKAGQTLVNVKGAQGVQSQCQQLCGKQGLRECPLAQDCTGSTVVPGQLFCVKTKCKAGEKLLRVAAVMFECHTVCSADSDCPKQRPSCGRDVVQDVDTSINFRTCQEASTPAPSARPSAAPDIRPPNPAFNTPVTPPPVTKVKCVLPSPPPCAAPHVASPKGLCQVPCSNGGCAACGGTCQAGFCVGG